MALRKNHRQLVDEANARITTLSLEEAEARRGRPGVVFVDLRDVRELQREGQIPDAVHAPRGMLEFWVDPDSPYHKPELDPTEHELILYCQSGWRSALATAALVDMGAEHVAHIDGGFSAWKAAGSPVTEPTKRD